jgi:cytochrome o ubiquinol oxidase subunit 2
MKKFLPTLIVVSICIAVVGGLGWLFAHGSYDVLNPKGEIASHQKSLLMFTLLLSAVVVIPVFFMLGLFAFKFREGKKKKSIYMPEWSGNKALETIWWGVPVAIIIVLAVVAWQTSHSLDPYRPIESSKKAIEVQVVALQWKWLFILPDYNVATLNYLPVPTGTPIHFTISADAPMSAFWVPALGSQIYAMNGMSSQLNLIADHDGVYKGYTTNINGAGYADMKFDVAAMPERAFKSELAVIANSDKTLDEHRYLHLVSPESVTARENYKLLDSDLYNHVILKYTSMDHAMTHDDMHKMLEGGAL